MSRASRYWLLVRVDSFGKCRTEKVEEVQAFFQEQFLEVIEAEDLSERDIQRQLMQWLQEDDSRRRMAELCLRCFISHQIKEMCWELEQKFGKNHDFTSRELLPLVLDSNRSFYRQVNDEVETKYQSLTTRILQTFDPEKSNLSTWTTRMLKSDRSVKQFLLERGIEQVTDWMILSYMNPGRLKRVLSDFDQTSAEINQALQLLDSYHQIYRIQLMQHRKAGAKSKYPDPTSEQLRQMAKQLSESRTISPEQVLKELQNLAQLLRNERIRNRIGSSRSEVLDSRRNTTYSGNDESDRSDFLTGYHRQFDTCLAGSVKQVIQERFSYWRGKKVQKAQNFLQALYLFHCQGVSMGEIAAQLGLKDQPRVSRLLSLKNLRSDIGRHTLLCLRDRVLELAKFYANPEQLLELESRVQAVLNEEVSTTIEAAKKEASTGSTHVMNSKLAKTICEYLDRRKSEI